SGQSRKDLVDRETKRFSFYPVDLDGELRHTGAERRDHALNVGLRLGVTFDGGDDRLKLGKIEATVPQLELHGDAGGIADALDRRRWQYGDPGFFNGIERLVETHVKREQVLALAAFAPILEHDIGDAGIGERCAVVENGDARNRDCLPYTR